MEATVRCNGCGSTWRVILDEGVSLTGELMDCPLCKRKA